MSLSNMQTTSIEAFYSIQASLNRREKELLEVLYKTQPASDRQLAYGLNWEIGQVNGRRNSLMQKGVVIKAYQDRSEITGRRVIYWKVNRELEQESLDLSN